eukprot:6750066-Lingulodinium_polyedra.AAC.1
MAAVSRPGVADHAALGMVEAMAWTRGVHEGICAALCPQGPHLEDIADPAEEAAGDHEELHRGVLEEPPEELSQVGRPANTTWEPDLWEDCLPFGP